MKRFYLLIMLGLFSLAGFRAHAELADDATPDETLNKWVEMQIEAANAEGAGWPTELTADYIEKSGLDWHVFPNTIFLHGLIDSVLWYRVRPNGHDPESCIFDVWALERYGPGKEPPLKREMYTNWRDGDWGLIYEQDFVLTHLPRRLALVKKP